MKRFAKIVLFSLLSLALCAPTADAQKSRKKKARKVKKEMHTAAYDSLYAAYDFATLLAYLHEDIATATENEESTHLQDSLMPIVEKAHSMMQSVERVEFVDSIVLPESQFFKHYGLSKSCGKIAQAKVVVANLKNLPPSALCHLNDFGDLAYFPLMEKDGARLAKSQKIAGVWQTPTLLEANVTLGEDANFPYVLSDGITLFYAAKGEASLGGYDIFVTRYDAGEGKFIAPENLGMPFNSPANDYLYVIDEYRGVGWFATDRGQEEGFVCVYKFVPHTPRRFYDPLITENLSALARIHSIRGDEKSGMMSSMRTMPVANSLEEAKGDFYFPVNDVLVYTGRSQFQSAEALGQLEEWLEIDKQVAQLKTMLKALLKLHGEAVIASIEADISPSDSSEVKKLRDEVKKVEQEIMTLEIRREELALSIRNAENKKLKKS